MSLVLLNKFLDMFDRLFPESERRVPHIHVLATLIEFVKFNREIAIEAGRTNPNHDTRDLDIGPNFSQYLHKLSGNDPDASLILIVY
jgi:hypothetical protein